MTYRFLGAKKKIWLAISILLIIPGLIAIFTWGLPLGIDFRGGAVMELTFDEKVGEGELREKVTGYEQVRGAVTSKTGEQSYILKVLPISEEEHRQIIEKVETDFGNVEETQFQSVGPTVSRDLTRKAVIAVVLASIMIILYLAYSFRGVRQPVSSWRFGVIAVIALLHDLIISVGIFAILAHYFNFEVDASFITALLTIMGFSVHDTIVVFDRVRENLITEPDSNTDFEQVADSSLQQTLNRSIATSVTVIFTLAALAVLGGESIRPFVVTLLVGITVGTYSSIFTATPLLAVWQNRVQRRG